MTADFARCNESQLNENFPTLFARQASITAENFEQQQKCSSCSRPGYDLLICSKCSTDYSATYYCNRECQARDWNIHRRECKHLPRLKRLEDVQQERQLHEGGPKPKFLVPFVDDFAVGEILKITHVQSSKILFVRPANRDFEELLEYIGKINGSKLVEKPEVDDTVLAPFKGSYHRAQIMDVFDDDVQVFFLDFGNSARMEWHHLRKLTFKGRSKPRQTFKVVLESNIANSRHNEEFLKYLESLHSKELDLRVTKLTRRGEDRYVTLEELLSGKVVNEFCNSLTTKDSGSRIFFNVSAKMKTFQI